MTSASTELRARIIAAIKADAGVQATALGATPRVHNRVPPDTPKPYLVVRTPKRPWNTTTEFGAEVEVNFHLHGTFEGDEEGEAIFDALDRLFRTWAPRAFSAHHLVELTCKFEDVASAEDGKDYFGVQRWSALTEEI